MSTYQRALGLPRAATGSGRWLRTALLASLVVALVLAGQSPVHAQGGAAYLKMGVGARAIGMGGAFTAVADDATALYWNPAGIAKLRRAEATAMHAQLSLDRDFDFVGYATPVTTGSGAWGASYTRFAVSGIPETKVRPGTNAAQLTDDFYDVSGNFLAAGPGLGTVRIFSLFDDVEQSVTGSYARKVDDKLYLGGTLRHLRQSLYTADGSGFGIDLGALYVPGPKWTFGVTAKDVGESIDFGSAAHDAKVDVTISGGAAYSGFKNTLVSAEATRTGHRGFKMRAGAERWFDEKYAVRLGVNEGDLSAGASLRANDWQFDYAFQAQDLGDIQRLSVAKRF